MRINDVNWNFDRVVRLTIKCPGAEIDYDKEGKKVDTVVVEYNPLDDGRKVARIDFTCEMLTQLSDITQPSYTAEIKLYNITDELANAIASGGADIRYIFSGNTVSDRRERYKARRGSRPQVKLEIGYYNHENPSETSLATIFDGYINSSFSARQGVDYVTTLQCWKFNGSLPDDVSWCLTETKDEYLDYKEEIEEKRGKPYKGTVENVLADLIWDYATERPSIVTEGKTKEISFDGSSSQMSKIEKEKNFSQQFSVPFNRPGDTWKENHEFSNVFSLGFYYDASGTLLNEDLRQKLIRAWGSDFVFYTNGETDLDKLLHSALAKTGYNLSYKKDENFNKSIDGEEKRNGVRFKWYVYEAGARGSKSPNPGSGGIKIINYQNVVETPVINGNGSMQLKTMIIPGITTKSALMLAIEDVDSDQVYNMGNSSFTGIKASTLSASVGKFVPLMTGEYNTAVLINDQKKRGSLFNTWFDIWKITFSGSTHTKDWYNTIFTFPTFLGRGKG